MRRFANAMEEVKSKVTYPGAFAFTKPHDKATACLAVKNIECRFLGKSTKQCRVNISPKEYAVYGWGKVR